MSSRQNTGFILGMTWQCECGHQSTRGVSQCRNCGRLRPGLQQQEPQAKQKQSKSREVPLEGEDEEQIFKSTLIFKKEDPE